MCKNSSKTTTIQIRVTHKEKEKIQNRKEFAGYKSLSDYVRRILIGEELTILQMVQEIHKEVCNGS